VDVPLTLAPPGAGAADGAAVAVAAVSPREGRGGQASSVHGGAAEPVMASGCAPMVGESSRKPTVRGREVSLLWPSVSPALSPESAAGNAVDSGERTSECRLRTDDASSDADGDKRDESERRERRGDS